MNTRRNYMGLSSAEQQQYIQDFLVLKTTMNNEYLNDLGGAISEWDFSTFLHNYATNFSNTDWAHFHPEFPMWHRNHLLRFERSAQEVLQKPGWTLPYWDWTQSDDLTQQLINIWGGWSTTNDTLGDAWGGYVINAPWYNGWICVADHGLPMDDPHLRRCIACIPSADTTPSAGAVAYTLNASHYETWPYNISTDCGWNTSTDCVIPEAHSFRNFLEGWTVSPTDPTQPADPTNKRDMHNRVHSYCGGHMHHVPVSANDPLFYLHHTMVDLVLERWFRSHPAVLAQGYFPVSGAPPGTNKYDCLFPFYPIVTPSQFYELSTSFGYTYDILGLSPASMAMPTTALGMLLTLGVLGLTM